MKMASSAVKLTFLICGASKSGTTSLYRYCSEHPDVVMSQPKETGFFVWNYDKGIDWFTSCFSEYEEEEAIGEATPGNMYHPLAAKRIKQHVPDAELIFILRNPIDRAYSDYHYRIAQNLELPTYTFSELIRNREHEFGNRLINRGLYAKHLARFDQYFEPEQIKLVLHRDLREHPLHTMQTLYDFIGVDASVTPSVSERHNRTKYPRNLAWYRKLRNVWQPVKKLIGSSAVHSITGLRNKVRGLFFQKNGERPRMRPDDRRYLREVFQETREKISQRTNRDLSHWV